MTAHPLVTDPSACKGAGFRGDASWIRTLTMSEVEELAAAARRCLEGRLPATEIGREDFPLETLGRTIAGWAEEINEGRGFLLVRGLPADSDNQTVRSSSTITRRCTRAPPSKTIRRPSGAATWCGCG